MDLHRFRTQNELFLYFSKKVTFYLNISCNLKYNLMYSCNLSAPLLLCCVPAGIYGAGTLYIIYCTVLLVYFHLYYSKNNEITI